MEISLSDISCNSWFWTKTTHTHPTIIKSLSKPWC